MNFLCRLSSLASKNVLQTPIQMIGSASKSRAAFSTLPLLRSFEQNSGSFGQISGFLKPVSGLVKTKPSVAGLKHVANPKRRCSSCYAVVKVLIFKLFKSISISRVGDLGFTRVRSKILGGLVLRVNDFLHWV